MHKIFGFIVLLLLFGCDKEKEIRSTSLQAPLVTGFLFIDSNGSPIQQVGKPNVKTDFEKEGYKYSLTAYPNPASYQVAVSFQTSKPATKISIWVVAARQDETLNSFNFIQANTAIIGGQPLIKIEPAYTQRTNILNIRNLPTGAYRVYAQIDDVLLWDNILKIN